MLADFEVLDTWMAARCGRIVPLRSTLTPMGGLKDPSTMLVSGVPSNAIDLRGITVEILYTDANGDDSARRIHLRKGWRTEHDGHVSSFCELRGKPRRFCFSGIGRLLDCATGEIVTDVSTFFDHLGVLPYDAKRSAMWQSVRAGIVLLMALATTDEALVSDELEAVVVYADRRAEALGLTMTEIDHARVLQTARRLRPDIDAAREALRDVMADRSHAMLIARSMRALSAADDVVCAAERAFLNDVMPTR
jgi:hypothetical protein